MVVLGHHVVLGTELGHWVILGPEPRAPSPESLPALTRPLLILLTSVSERETKAPG